MVSSAVINAAERRLQCMRTRFIVAETPPFQNVMCMLLSLVLSVSRVYISQRSQGFLPE